jgi:hypothetical protein
MKTPEQIKRNRAACKKYRAKNSEKLNELNRQWHADHPDYAKQRYAALTEDQKEKYRARQSAYYAANSDKRRAASRSCNLSRKLRIIAAYGGKCECCGDTHHQFLTIDHIKGGGAKHVKSLNIGRGHAFYCWLERQGYPKDDFRLLCWNCNAAEGILGGCPHRNEVFVPDVLCNSGEPLPTTSGLIN